MSCNARGIRNAARKPCARVGGEKPAYYVADSAPTGMNAVGVAAAGFSLGGPVRKTVLESHRCKRLIGGALC